MQILFDREDHPFVQKIIINHLCNSDMDALLTNQSKCKIVLDESDAKMINDATHANFKAGDVLRPAISIEVLFEWPDGCEAGAT